MSLIDKLGLSAKKKTTPTFSNYNQKQEYLKAQEKKRQALTLVNKAVTKIVARECPICEKVMSVPVGTIMHCHKECKPRFKRAVRRIAKK